MIREVKNIMNMMEKNILTQMELNYKSFFRKMMIVVYLETSGDQKRALEIKLLVYYRLIIKLTANKLVKDRGQMERNHRILIYKQLNLLKLERTRLVFKLMFKSSQQELEQAIIKTSRKRKDNMLNNTMR